MRVSPFTVAEESLRMSDAARGISGMDRTSAPMGPNMFDGGPASKVQANTQPYNNARMMEQNIEQNTAAAIPQAASSAVQQGRKMQLVGDNQEYKANQKDSRRHFRGKIVWRCFKEIHQCSRKNLDFSSSRKNGLQKEMRYLF